MAGFDWDDRAACLVAALWPDRVSGLVSIAGSNVQPMADALAPAEPAVGRTLWYQYYLHGDRGRAGLARYRAEFARTLWAEWSPRWSFTDQQFHRTSVAFDPDFVDVVVHSHRHRYGWPPATRYQHTEDQIAAQPRIELPTIVLDGSQDTVIPPAGREQHRQHFSRLLDHRYIDAGHNIPQGRPTAFVEAVMDLSQPNTR